MVSTWMCRDSRLGGRFLSAFFRDYVGITLRNLHVDSLKSIMDAEKGPPLDWPLGFDNSYSLNS